MVWHFLQLKFKLHYVKVVSLVFARIMKLCIIKMLIIFLIFNMLVWFLLMQWMKEWAREPCTKLFSSLQLLFVLVFYKYSSSSICLNESWGSPEFSFRHREDNILLPKPCKLRCIHFLCLFSEGRILPQKLERLMSFFGD